jgi:hypothetical protein
MADKPDDGDVARGRRDTRRRAAPSLPAPRIRRREPLAASLVRSAGGASRNRRRAPRAAPRSWIGSAHSVSESLQPWWRRQWRSSSTRPLASPMATRNRAFSAAVAPSPLRRANARKRAAWARSRHLRRRRPSRPRRSPACCSATRDRSAIGPTGGALAHATRAHRIAATRRPRSQGGSTARESGLSRRGPSPHANGQSDRRKGATVRRLASLVAPDYARNPIGPFSAASCRASSRARGLTATHPSGGVRCDRRQLSPCDRSRCGARAGRAPAERPLLVLCDSDRRL